MLMRPKHSIARLLTRKTSGVQDLIAASQLNLRNKCLVTLGCPARGQSRAFYSFVTACRASKLGQVSYFKKE
jgi:hypothetical protein